jgi:DNA-binding MarR family transcriptional regulator
VVLTDAGRTLHAAVKSEAATVRRELLAGIDPESVETATRLLEELTRKIDAAA